MFRFKLVVLFAFAVFAISACFESKPTRFAIADDKSYASSLFRQNSAVCHGPEADGRTLDDGTKVPSLREGDFKFKTKAQILDQLANGGNGMTPFRDQLTAREREMMADLVLNDLRAHPQK